jgi:hypothetical protein
MNLPKFVMTNTDKKIIGHGDEDPPVFFDSLDLSEQVPEGIVHTWRLRKVGKNQFYALVDKCVNCNLEDIICECIKCQLKEMQKDG